MITIRNWALQYLTDRGLFLNQAEQVLASVELQDVLHKPIEDYPSQFKAVIVLALRHAAVAWIDANLPRHFARAVFEENPHE